VAHEDVRIAVEAGPGSIHPRPPYEVEDEVTEEVVAAERRIELVALVEDAAGDRGAGVGVRVHMDRGDRPVRTLGGRREALAHRPPEIVAGTDHVDLLEGVLTDIADPEQPGPGIEGEPEGVAQPGGEDEVRRAATSQERIARRRRTVERQPQDLAVEAAEI